MGGEMLDHFNESVSALTFNSNEKSLLGAVPCITQTC